jgi:hypothetical protein
MFHVPYSDTTNAFKAYRKELLDCMNLSSAGFEIFLEIPLKTMLLGDVRTDEIDVHHVIRKKKSAKLSLIRDGYKYVRLLLSLLKSARVGDHLRGAPLQRDDSARSSGEKQQYRDLPQPGGTDGISQPPTQHCSRLPARGNAIGSDHT